MNSKRAIKFTFAIIFLTIAAGAHIFSSPTSYYPLVNTVFISVLLLMLAIVYMYRSESSRIKYIIFPLIALSVAYRTIIFTSSASIPGIDPQKHLLQAARVAQSGTVDSINLSLFYERAPNYFVYIAEGIMILDTSASQSLLLVSVSSGVMLPLLAYAIANRVTSHKPVAAGVTAAILVTSACWSLKFSYMPIPQTLALLLFSCWMMLMSRSRALADKRIVFTGTLLLASSAFIHKLFLVLAAGGLIGVIAIFATHNVLPKLKRKSDISLSRSHLLIYCILIGVLAFSQWFFLTQYIEYIVVDVVFVLAEQILRNPWDLVFSPGSFSSYQPTAAVKPDSRLFSISGARAKGTYMFMFVGMISFLILWAKRRTELLITLGVHGFIVGIAVFGLAGPNELELRRLFFVLELVYAVHISTALWSVNSATIKRILMISVLLVISLQTISTPVAPDHPNSPRYYLTSGEVDGKNFAYEHTDGTVAADPYLQATVTDVDSRIDEPTKFSTLRQALTEKGLKTQRPEFILHRTNVDTYWFGKLGNWKLTWGVESHLDQRYNKTYSSGKTNLYT